MHPTKITHFKTNHKNHLPKIHNQSKTLLLFHSHSHSYSHPIQQKHKQKFRLSKKNHLTLNQ